MVQSVNRETGVSPVLVSRDGSIATVTLNRPDRLNAVSLPLYRALDTELAALSDDPEIRAVILTGAGRAFCVGADLDAHASGSGGAEAKRTYVEAAQAAAHRIQTLSVPVVAAANGHAIGAGLELLVACDLAVVASGAKLRFPEVGLGTFVGGGVTATLDRVVGRARARELLFLCPMFTGAEALDMGLVNRAVPADQVLAQALSIARELAAKAPLSLALAKNLLHRSPHLVLDSVLDLEAEALLRCMETSDWREGVEAFQEKRDPRFEGR
ncbi:MAG: enoyl-CoA hydratase-related protein [Gemmatimonadota bacterium]